MSAIHGVNYGAPTLDLNFAKNKSLIDTVTGRNLVTFTRSQTARGATYVGADGLIKTAAANEPRFDHNPTTGESLGLLVEEARTNLRTLSTDFSSGWGFNDNVTIASGQTSPTGDSTASLVTINAGTFVARIGEKFVSGGTVYTRSLFVKKTNQRYIWCGDQNNGNYSPNYRFDLDLGTGTVVSGGGFNSGFLITPFSNGYYRISVSCSSGDIFTWTANNNASINPLNFSTGNVFHNGTESFIVWGYQVETGAFPTSYIPTTSATVTRAADVASITGTNFSSWYNQSQGTWFVDFANDAAKHNSGFDGVLSLDTNTPRIIGSLIVGFGGESAISPVSARQKVGLAYGTTEGRSFNGTISSGSGGTVSSRTQVRIGTGAVTAPNYELSTTINRLTYWPTRLQDFQLQQLTK